MYCVELLYPRRASTTLKQASRLASFAKCSFIGTIILLRWGRDASTGTEKAKSKSSLIR